MKIMQIASALAELELFGLDHRKNVPGAEISPGFEIALRNLRYFCAVARVDVGEGDRHALRLWTPSPPVGERWATVVAGLAGVLVILNPDPDGLDFTFCPAREEGVRAPLDRFYRVRGGTEFVGEHGEIVAPLPYLLPKLRKCLEFFDIVNNTDYWLKR